MLQSNWKNRKALFLDVGNNKVEILTVSAVSQDVSNNKVEILTVSTAGRATF